MITTFIIVPYLPLDPHVVRKAIYPFNVVFPSLPLSHPLLDPLFTLLLQQQQQQLRQQLHHKQNERRNLRM